MSSYYIESPGLGCPCSSNSNGWMNCARTTPLLLNCTAEWVNLSNCKRDKSVANQHRTTRRSFHFILVHSLVNWTWTTQQIAANVLGMCHPPPPTNNRDPNEPDKEGIMRWGSGWWGTITGSHHRNLNEITHQDCRRCCCCCSPDIVRNPFGRATAIDHHRHPR